MLQSIETDTPGQLNQFHNLLNKNRTKLEVSRDTATTYFLKMLLSILTIGLANQFGLWAVKGKDVACDMETILSAPGMVS